MSQPSSQKTKKKINLQLIEKLVDLVCFIEIELVSSVVIVYSLYGLV